MFEQTIYRYHFTFLNCLKRKKPLPFSGAAFSFNGINGIEPGLETVRNRRHDLPWGDRIHTIIFMNKVVKLVGDVGDLSQYR